MDPEEFALGGDVAARARCERVAEKLQVELLEVGRGGSDGVKGAGGDYIVTRGVVSEELEIVADEDGQTGFVEEGGHVLEILEILLGHLDDGLRGV